VFAFTMRESLFTQLGFRPVPVTDFPQKLVTDYGGLALAAGRKAAVVLDLEAARSGATPPRLPPPSERGGGPLKIGMQETTALRPRLDTLQKKRHAMSDAQRQNRSIAILGGGNLGRALAMGWVESGYCSADQIRIARRNPGKLTFFAEAGFQVGSDNVEAVRSSD